MPDPTPIDALPTAEPEAFELSQRLTERIRHEIARHQGWLPFDRFMELALYSPGLGYYSNALRKFGEAGDFVTAPELTPLFGRCLARQCAEVLNALGTGDILEFGAGSGRLAADLLAELARLGRLPGRYLILELSAPLRARQQALLRQELPGLMGLVQWLDRLPEPFCGLVLANEVLDAMPVDRFRLGAEGIEEQFITTGDEGLVLCWGPARSPGLAAAVQALARRHGLTAGYSSEINRRGVPWIEAVAGCMRQGLALLLDYGYSGREFYHPQRDQGTLLCHYRHRVHGDPLWLPGLQDITASVDFTALAEAALAAGFDSHAYTSQAHFLLANGLDALLAETDSEHDPRQRLRALQAVKRLTLPNEMGERFKVLGLGKGIGRLPRGFALHGLPL